MQSLDENVLTSACELDLVGDEDEKEIDIANPFASE